MNSDRNSPVSPPAERIDILMPENFSLAYLKPIQTERGKGVGVYDAGGMQLAVFPDYDTAFFAARREGLDPVQVH